MPAAQGTICRIQSSRAEMGGSVQGYVASQFHNNFEIAAQFFPERHCRLRGICKLEHVVLSL